jgi:S-DNA-T family DNA segregation ATPase FtsK/SpoIIIE
MPGASKQIRRTATAEDNKPARFKLGISSPGRVFDGVFLLIAAISAAAVFGFFPEVREGLITSLGYGWAPVILWAVTALVLLRYRPRYLIRFWRWAVVAAALVVVVIGALSFVYAGGSILAYVSWSGEWGQVLGGESLVLALLEVAALAVLLPLLLHPQKVGRWYRVASQRVGHWLRVAWVYSYPAAKTSLRFMAHQLRLIFGGNYLRRFLGPVATFLTVAIARIRHKSAPARPMVQDTVSPESFPESLLEPFQEPETNLWRDLEPEAAATNWEPTAKSDAYVASGEPVSAIAIKGSKWKLPSISLLSPPEPNEAPEEPLKEMAKHIEATLADHGVNVAVEDIKAGPRIVRFGLVPGWVPRRGDSGKGEDASDNRERSRVKVQSILTREKDLALALKTPNLRIEAPVPGEALVGLEVPTPTPTKVHLRAVMEHSSFTSISTKGGMPVALGEDTGGDSVSVDLAGMPHMLIAGATGSGKSVCINSIVASLLLTRPPDQMRMLMIDPKRVELTPFNGIPHLIAPVIVDVEEVAPALRGLNREMIRRYKLMEEIGTRNIEGYNSKSREQMPYLVLIVDELADLMMAGGFEIEQSLVRLAQLGRASGIHLIVATQRPSVNVVTGLLKANVPCRVAFAVASQVDSRVILDTVGAEKLLGRGDMLLLSKDSPKPRRVQGTLVYDEEIDKLVEFWINQKGPALPVISLEEPEESDEDADLVDDALVDRARDLAIRNPHLSSSLLERRLKIGGRRADQIIEALEEEGLVIPG